MAERKAPAQKAAPRKAVAAKKAAPKKAQPKAVTEPEPTAAEPQPATVHAPGPDQELGRGFIGDHTDPTPNEHYTLSGVLAGKPVPEHDRPVG